MAARHRFRQRNSFFFLSPVFVQFYFHLFTSRVVSFFVTSCIRVRDWIDESIQVEACAIFLYVFCFALFVNCIQSSVHNSHIVCIEIATNKIRISQLQTIGFGRVHFSGDSIFLHGCKFCTLCESRQRKYATDAIS